MFFEGSTSFPPPSKSLLTIHEVDAFLERLSQLTKEDEQQKELEDISRKCTANDLKCIIRLIKHDLKMNSGAKHVLDAVDPNAYDAFKASRNLGDVVDRVLRNQHEAASSSGPRKILSVEASLMTPVQPMLAEACKSIEYAMKKCPNGMYSEIKYDGERVQVHKNGDHFSYFSRSLKPVLPHKVAHFKEFIPQAFPGGNSIILDAEVLLIDTRTSKPLPFGSLGVHKKAAFQDAKVCLFVFDCIFFNGVSLMDRPLRERKKFLHENMVEIPNRILFSEMKHVTRAADLADMITRVIREGLEGLVLKDVKGLYEPGKRHWLKVKKDYLNEGAMADTADLVVLGAFYGTGSKGGMMSVFLMGCYDPASQMWCTVTKCAGGHDDATLARLQSELDMVKISGMMSVFLMGCYDPASQIWCTVTKCSGGHDDATLARLQSELDMVKISKEPSKIPGWLKINKNYYPDFVARDPKEPSKIPGWLKINKNYYPDFVARDPKKAAVWEITGAEFSKAEAHTADGISIRFPRCTRIRDDKDWQSATNLPQLRELFRLSKETSDFEVTAGPSKSSSGGESASSTPPSTSTASSSKLTAASSNSTPRAPPPVKIENPSAGKAVKRKQPAEEKHTKKVGLPRLLPNPPQTQPRLLPNPPQTQPHLLPNQPQTQPHLLPNQPQTQPSLLPSPPPSPAQPATNTATSPAQPATNTATSPAQPATNTATSPAQPATNTATSPAQPATNTATSPAQPATNTATSPAQPATNTATSPVQPATNTAMSAAQSATNPATSPAKSGTKSK
ncbi:UNVERIFIED_CONTAM: hypothetical protein FKN15_029102 [Acipenser sinensis]